MNFSKAFSLVETFIIVIVLAIAVAAATPTITRKIINVQRPGVTIGGGNHGSYTLYDKEVIDFGGVDSPEADPSPDSWEKVVKEKPESHPQEKTYIYEKHEEGTTTIYEELEDLKPTEAPDGTITEAKGTLKTENQAKTFRRSRKYIFEDSRITYIKYNPDGKSTKVEISNARIIESNYATLMPDKSSRGYRQWKVSKSGHVHIVPWHRLITGSRVVIDEKIKPNKDGFVNFTPPTEASKLRIYALGGGGAGGTPTKKAIDEGFLSSMDTSRASELIADFKKRIPGASSKIKIENGVIKVTLDVRTGQNPYIFPTSNPDTGNVDGLGVYTELLGSPTQTKLTCTPTSWITWETLEKCQYKAAVVTQGGAGGSAGVITWSTNNQSSDAACKCMKDIEDEVETYTATGETVTNCDVVCNSATDCCYDRKCKRGKSDYYTCGAAYPVHKKVGAFCAGDQGSAMTSCGDPKCSSITADCKRNGTEKARGPYNGGVGGDQPPAVCSKVDIGNIVKYSISSGCQGDYIGAKGDDGGSLHYGTNYGPNSTSQKTNATTGVDGSPGTTCYQTIESNGKSASGRSNGGGPGIACIQKQVTITTTVKDAMTGEVIDSNTSTPLNWNDQIAEAEASGGSYSDPNYTPGTGGGEAITKLTDSSFTQTWDFSCDWACSPSCLIKNGDDGTKVGDNCTGSLPGVNKNTPGIYNYKFVWEIPFATRYFGYGEAGQAAQPKPKVMLNPNKPLKLHVGRGGYWKTIAYGANGPDGEESAVYIDNEKIVHSPGGKGGKGGLETAKYDVCFDFSQKPTCKFSDNTTRNVCEDKLRSTQEVKSTVGKASKFDSMKTALDGNQIVGLGLGRSGEGLGTRTDNDLLKGTRKFYNALIGTTAYVISQGKTFYEKKDGNPDYKNKLYTPPAMNLKGGDGAIIIIW